MTEPHRVTRQSKQSGGTSLGVMLGLIVGLVIAAAVALYVTRAPSPFVSKSGQPPPTAPAATEEAQFDPNRMLQGNAASQVAAASQPAPGPAQTSPGMLNSEPRIVEVPPAAKRPPAENAANSGENINENRSENRSETSRASSGYDSDNLAAVAAAARRERAKAAEASRAASALAQEKPVPPARPAPRPRESVSSAIPLSSGTGYFLQVGAYKTPAEAEQQRARLGLQGFETKITQRNVAGVTYYRVRVGPFPKQDDLNAPRQRLSEAGVDSAIFKVVRAGQQ